jgi:hypothetical protein
MSANGLASGRHRAGEDWVTALSLDAQAMSHLQPAFNLTRRISTAASQAYPGVTLKVMTRDSQKLRMRWCTDRGVLNLDRASGAVAELVRFRSQSSDAANT